MKQNKVNINHDQRIQIRHAFEPFEKTEVHFNIKSNTYQGKIVNLNSKGIMIEFECKNLNLVTKGSYIENIKILYEKKEIGFIKNSILCHSSLYQGVCVIGVRFEQTIAEVVNENKITDIRNKLRLKINETKPITGYFKHPFKFDDKIFFTVIDINKYGMKVCTSIRNRMLLPGAIYENVTLQIPTCKDVIIVTKTVNVDVESIPDKIILHLNIMNQSSIYDSEIAKYYLTFHQTNSNDKIHSLKRAGFIPKKIKERIEYGYMQTIEDYHKVLELRVKAYSQIGKIPKNSTPQDMSDLFDANSNIIIAKLHNQIIGSVRMTLCENINDKYELDDSIEIPKRFNRLKTIEISRLSVDPDYQNTDVVLGLLERCTQLVLQRNLTHVITSCIDEMVPYYYKLGFKKQGITFQLKTLHNIPHHFLALNIKTVRTSYDLNPLYWYYTYRDIVAHMELLNYDYQENLSIFKKIFLRLFLIMFKSKLIKSLMLKSK